MSQEIYLKRWMVQRTAIWQENDASSHLRISSAAGQRMRGTRSVGIPGASTDKTASSATAAGPFWMAYMGSEGVIYR